MGKGLELLTHDGAELALGGLAERGSGSPQRAHEGRTTLESLQAVRSIFQTRGLSTAVFVSDRTHMLRVLRMASDLGFDAYGSPTTSSPSDLDPGRRQKAMLHELAGLAAYYVGGGRLLQDAAISSAP